MRCEVCVPPWHVVRGLGSFFVYKYGLISCYCHIVICTCYLSQLVRVLLFLICRDSIDVKISSRHQRPLAHLQTWRQPHPWPLAQYANIGVSRIRKYGRGNARGRGCATVVPSARVSSVCCSGYYHANPAPRFVGFNARRGVRCFLG